jgi:hypothetical protein
MRSLPQKTHYLSIPCLPALHPLLSTCTVENCRAVHAARRQWALPGAIIVRAESQWLRRHMHHLIRLSLHPTILV